MATASELPTGMRRRPSNVGEAEGSLIDLPRTPAERTLARKTLVALHGTSDEGSTKREPPVLSQYARAALVSAYRRGWRAGPLVSVRLDKLSDAKHWVRLLSAVGIKADFVAEHVPGLNSQAGSPAVQRQHWTAAGIEIREASEGSLVALERVQRSRGCIIIRPRPDAARGRRMRLYGFAWALAVSCMTDQH